MSSDRVEFPNMPRPSTNVPIWRAVVVAVGITGAIFLALYPLKGAFIRDLMMGSYSVEADRIIFQGCTLFLWSLSIASILLKNGNVRRERRVLLEDPLPPDLDIHDFSALSEHYRKLAGHPQFAQRMGLARVAKVLAIWINSRDFERTAQFAKEESDLDANLSESSFRANRLYIWAMPLLGFLGTVYGVSYGIGGFAEFLRGEVTVEQMTFQVGLITEGLAVAFYTTLVGLAAAGTAAFPGLSCERKEEALLGDIDEYIQDRLISRLPSVRKLEFPTDQIFAIQRSIEQIRDALKQPVAELVVAIRDGFARMPDPRTYQSVFASAIEEAAGLINTKYGEFMIRYEHRVDELAQVLARRLESVAERFHTGSEKMVVMLEAQQAGLSAQGEQQASRFAAAREEGLRALADVRTVSAEMSTLLHQSAARLGESADTYAARLGLSTEALTGQVDRLTAMAANIDSLLNATQAMQSTLANLSSSEDFRKTLAALQEHLQTSQELLRRLSRPRTVEFTDGPRTT